MFSFLGKHIIKALFLLLLTCGSLYAQETKIMGTVTDSVSGEIIPFVNIYFNGTTDGVMSDFDGNFSINSYTATDTLVASFVGYKKQKIAIKKGQFQEIHFTLQTSTMQLNEFVLVAGENPAEIILRKIIENKTANNPNQYNAYEYELYSKIEIDANNITEKFQERRAFKEFQFIFDYQDTSSLNGKTYLPIFLSEIVSDVYSSNDPKGNIEIIKASKVSGVEDESIMQLMSDNLLSVQVYDNYIPIFEKNFISPIADFSLSLYKYYLVDSAYIDSMWCKKIMFKPRHRQTLCFTGNFWVEENSYAIKEIEMRIADDANVNFVNDLLINKEYDLIDGKYWLLTKDYSYGDFNLIENTKKTLGFFGRKTSSYRDFKINQAKEKQFYNKTVDVIVLDSAFKYSDEDWNKMRHNKLNKNEQTVYFIIDTLQEIPKFNTYIDIIEMIATGYYVWGNVELGKYASTISLNPVEGPRFRFGGRTSNKFSTKIMFDAYLAYGTKDETFKYGGGFIYMFNKNPRRAFHTSYKYDIEQLGLSQNALREDFFLTFLFRRQPADKLSIVREYKMVYEHEWFPGLMNTIQFNNREIFPVGENVFSFYNQSNPNQSLTKNSIVTSEISLKTRFAYKERIQMGEFERISLGAKYPIIELNYSYGIPQMLGGNYEYHRLQLSVRHWFHLWNLGRSKFIIEGGKIWGKLPYPLLKIHEGNESLIFDQCAFNMMNYYEFISDKYFSVYYTHHFEGLFFNRVPLFRKLKWREVVYGRGLVGSINEKNKDFSILPDGTHTVNKPYFEAGAGIENIFKVFRVDAIWRLSYLEHENVSPFGVRFGMRFSF
jgi:Family of unknown function (DUF5686)/CarboxypepD_reg-like domain